MLLNDAGAVGAALFLNDVGAVAAAVVLLRLAGPDGLAEGHTQTVGVLELKTKAFFNIHST